MHSDIVLEVCKLDGRGWFKSLAAITVSKMLEKEEQEQKQGQVSPHCLTLGYHSSPVLGAFPYSPRQLGNSHAVRIFVRIRAPSTNFASFGSSAYPQAERDPPPPVLAGLRWAHFQWLSTRGKFEHQREVERARTRSGERAEGKPSLSGHVQAASCRVEELRPAKDTGNG